MESAPILRVTIFYGVFMAFAMQFGTILDSIGKPKLNFYITLLGAVINLSFNFIFIKWLGLYGAAYGSLTAMTIMFIIMQIILNRLLGIKAWHTLNYMMAFYKEIWEKLSVFLNGLINDRRGKKDGEQPKPEKELNNNIIFRKLKIALNLKEEDILDIFSLVGMNISKHEISAFFRSPEQHQYRLCKDQILRNFIQGLQLKYRT